MDDEEKVDPEGEEEPLEKASDETEVEVDVKIKPKAPTREDKRAPSNNNSILKGEVIPSAKKQRVARPVGIGVRKKKSLSDNISQTFFGEESRGVLEHILYEVLIPALKDTVSDMVTSGIDLLLFGGERRSGRRYRDSRDRDRRYINYSDYSRRYSRRDEEEAVRDLRRSAKGRFNLDEIFFKDRREADDVLDGLIDLLDEFRVVTVHDFYELADIRSRTWADKKWGWENLDSAYVTHTRNGHHIMLPAPRELE